MKHQIIAGPDGKPAFAVIAWDDFQRLAEIAMTDEKLFLAAQATQEESFPMEMVNRLLDGANPVKVFREYRGLTQRDLAQEVGINPVYLSPIETGKRGGGTKVLAAIAKALKVDLDDLV